MPRFGPDEPTAQVVSSPTPTLNNESSVVPVVRDEEAGRTTKPKWYQTRKLSGDKEKKSEKVEDVESVEEVDGVWGKHVEGTPNYKNVGW